MQGTAPGTERKTAKAPMPAAGAGPPPVSKLATARSRFSGMWSDLAPQCPWRSQLARWTPVNGFNKRCGGAGVKQGRNRGLGHQSGQHPARAGACAKPERQVSWSVSMEVEVIRRPENPWVPVADRVEQENVRARGKCLTREADVLHGAAFQPQYIWNQSRRLCHERRYETAIRGKFLPQPGGRREQPQGIARQAGGAVDGVKGHRGGEAGRSLQRLGRCP